MSRDPELFERAWGRMGAAAGFDEAVLRQMGALKVESELRVAAGIRGVAAALPEPDVDAAWSELARELEDDSPGVGGSRLRRRWAVPSLIAACLSLMTLLGAAAGAAPGSVLYPVRKGLERVVQEVLPGGFGIDARVAQARLDDLVTALRDRRYDLAPNLADDLVQARRRAVAAGANVDALDSRILRDLPPALRTAPIPVQQTVQQILGGLLPSWSFSVGPWGGSTPGWPTDGYLAYGHLPGQPRHPGPKPGHGPPPGHKPGHGPPPGHKPGHGPPPGHKPGHGPPPGHKPGHGPPPGHKPGHGPPSGHKTGHGPPSGHKPGHGPPSGHKPPHKK